MKQKLNIALVFYFPKQIFTAKHITSTEILKKKSQLLQKKTHTQLCLNQTQKYVNSQEKNNENIFSQN